MNDDRPTYAQRVMAARAQEITDRTGRQVSRFVVFRDGQGIRTAGAMAAAETLNCLMEEATFFGEDAVTVRHLKRLRDQLNPADTRGEGNPE